MKIVHIYYIHVYVIYVPIVISITTIFQLLQF